MKLLRGLWLLPLMLLASRPVQADWNLIDAGISAPINSVSYPVANHAWVCDGSGHIWTTSDGGGTWNDQVSFDFTDLRGISFADGQFGTVAAFGGNIYRTLDGGANWNTVQEGFLLTLYDAFAIPGTQTAYVAGVNTIFQPFVQWTTDGWVSNDALSFYIDIGGVGNEGQIRSIYAFDLNTLIAGCRVFTGEGAICRTTDGGASWTTVWNGMVPVMDVAFRDNEVGLAVLLDGSILRSMDGGVNWEEVLPGTGTPLTGVAFGDADNAWAVGHEGTILHSMTFGSSWIPEQSGTMENLYSVDFVDPDHGITVGNAGTVLVYGGGGGPTANLDLIPTNTDIPPSGGTVFFDISFVSTYPNTVPGLRFWTVVAAPNEQNYGPFNSQNFTHTPFMNVYVAGQTLHIPANAPSGDYTMTGNIGFFPTSLLQDSFTFLKEGGAMGDGYVFDPSEWNSGGDWISGQGAAVQDVLPARFELSQPYPNPFNPAATFQVTLPETSELTVQVFDIAGRRVATLADGIFSTGRRRFTFDGENLASGVYFLHVVVPGHFDQVRKLTLIR